MANIPDNLAKEIKELIAEVVGKTPQDLSAETNFWEELGIDSIKAIEIVVALEKKYRIRIREDQMPKIATLNEAILAVQDALKNKS